MGNRRKPSKDKDMRDVLRRKVSRLSRGDAMDFGRLGGIIRHAYDQMNDACQAMARQPKTPDRQQAFKAMEHSQRVLLLCMSSLLEVWEFYAQPGIGKKWTDAETEDAVMRRAEGETLESIAFRLDRTVQSVANRITLAVGIQQMEVNIKGMIDGELEHEHAEGMFQGVLRREPR